MNELRRAVLLWPRPSRPADKTVRRSVGRARSLLEKRLRIGIDGRNLRGATDGIGRFVHNSIKALAALGADLFVYAPDKINANYDLPHAVSVRLANFSGSLARTFWGQAVLPSLARRDHVDVFWGPSHRLPFRLDREIARVVTIHDLVWLHAADTMQAGHKSRRFKCIGRTFGLLLYFWE